MTDLLNGIAALSHLGVIRVAGEDAGAFLHSQLTQDFSSLDMRQARLAAFLSAKGRMKASFIGLRRPDERLLLCSRDLLPAALARPAPPFPSGAGRATPGRRWPGSRTPPGARPTSAQPAWCTCTPRQTSPARCGWRLPATRHRQPPPTPPPPPPL